MGRSIHTPYTKNYFVNNNTQFERKKSKNMNKRTLNNMCKPMLVGQEIFVSGQAKKAECAQRRN